MPRLEPKEVQRQLEKGEIWPVYWIYGNERMKSRELLKRIRKAVLGGEGKSEEKAEGAASLFGLGEEQLDATSVDAATVLDASQSLSLGGGLRFIIVRDAHALKEADQLEPLLGPPARREKLDSVCVFLSKDLDARKKFSKMLIEKAAVVACEDVPEQDREAWIQYLAKRKGVTMTPDALLQLTSLDPWSLDIIDQEMEKYSLAENSEDVLLTGSGQGDSSTFLDAFFRRDKKTAARRVEIFAERPDESLPLLGLLGWNVRQLALLLADREAGTRNVKLNPYILQRMQPWLDGWKLSEITELEAQLAEIDFSLKQTPLLPLALWDELVMKFCR